MRLGQVRFGEGSVTLIEPGQGQERKPLHQERKKNIDYIVKADKFDNRKS